MHLKLNSVFEKIRSNFLKSVLLDFFPSFFSIETMKLCVFFSLFFSDFRDFLLSKMRKSDEIESVFLLIFFFIFSAPFLFFFGFFSFFFLWLCVFFGFFLAFLAFFSSLFFFLRECKKF
eukprot:TRINITY_DN958_c0_g2_i2.p1 TRINITY_DN958_c0_g2~~TRINITY_DN958_c0_g2_i2.p1  ORF type:complete len:119 (-),score=56.86 TRINITY_DN958_c0_g2_i2:165-521(-)